MNPKIRRMMIALDGQERSALTKLAEQERRDPRDQAAVIIREALKSRGLLEVRHDCGEPNGAQSQRKAA